jgi:glycosyltransferase involved in cell wall biosynthesis
MDQPLVSIVTPCYNAAPFLERTINSILCQDYSNIEYIVMDGGSTDSTCEILKSYATHLQYVSASDGGAADAINRGFRRSHGRFFAWLNADDTYLAGAISAAVRALSAAPLAAVVYGEGLWTDEKDAVLGRYPTVSPYSAAEFERECFICQPTTLMRREAFDAVGMLDPALHFSFDYDLWIRLSRQYQFIAIPDILATSRMHSINKTLGQRGPVFRETIQLMQRHFEYVPVNWIYGYLSYLRDGRDQYFKPLRHSPSTYLAALFAGVCYNRRRPARFFQEWASRLTLRNWRQRGEPRLPGDASPARDEAIRR